MSPVHDEIIRDYGKVVMQSTQRFSPKDYARMALRFHKLYAPLLPSDQNSRIADIGCGDGHFLYYLKEAGYKNIVGVDASEDRLDLCRTHVTPSVEAADALRWLEERKGTFDAITCHHVIEHFSGDSVFDFTALLVGALKPGGRLILTTPNACTPWSGYNHYHDLTHYRLFTPDSLTQLFSRLGMTTKVYPEGAVAFDFPSSLRWLAWKVREAWLKISFLIDIGGVRGNQKTPLIVSNNLIAVVQRPS